MYIIKDVTSVVRKSLSFVGLIIIIKYFRLISFVEMGENTPILAVPKETR